MPDLWKKFVVCIGRGSSDTRIYLRPRKNCPVRLGAHSHPTFRHQGQNPGHSSGKLMLYQMS